MYWHQECGDNPYKFEGFARGLRNPLNTRAWTLQERELSPRKVLFSESMLLWECATIKASSELPWHERIFDTDEAPEPDSAAWGARQCAGRVRASAQQVVQL